MVKLEDTAFIGDERAGFGSIRTHIGAPLPTSSVNIDADPTLLLCTSGYSYLNRDKRVPILGWNDSLC